ncbi:MAG TPA: helix-turn-helix domain-containing protein [Trebonia sp.]
MTEVDGPLTMREQQRAFTRSRLMETAQQLFAARGYPDTTVDDIARAAGASRATFYLHFKSKAELMSALIDAVIPVAVETYHELDKQLADPGPELPGRLRGWLAEWLERWTGDAQASHALLQATMLEPEVEMHYLRLSEALVDALTGYFDRMPAGARADARERALMLEIMTQRIFALASRSKLPVTRERLLDILAEFWLQVFAAERTEDGTARTVPSP